MQRRDIRARVMGSGKGGGGGSGGGGPSMLRGGELMEVSRRGRYEDEVSERARKTRAGQQASDVSQRRQIRHLSISLRAHRSAHHIHNTRAQLTCWLFRQRPAAARSSSGSALGPASVASARCRWRWSRSVSLC